ncbi:MAG: hypothetical protein ACREM3_27970 [Candidatus Rokuibacteriota bacterium]
MSTDDPGMRNLNDDEMDDDLDLMDNDDEEEHAGDDAEPMRTVCGFCGEANRVLPPNGYRLAEAGKEDADDGLGPKERMQYTCASCEAPNSLRVPAGRRLVRVGESTRGAREAVATFVRSYREAW